MVRVIRYNTRSTNPHILEGILVLNLYVILWLQNTCLEKFDILGNMFIHLLAVINIDAILDCELGWKQGAVTAL